MNSKLYCSAFFLVAGLIVAIAGCGKESTTTVASKAPPKLDFHKPRNFTLAVERLRKIHDMLATESEVPQPISYTVVEVSHSHGDGNSHVHYKLVGSTGSHGEDCDCGHDHGSLDEHFKEHDDKLVLEGKENQSAKEDQQAQSKDDAEVAGNEHDHHDHDDHGHRDPFESGPPQHTIVVDVFTELSDIVRWLPAIAADGDMPADDWKQVKSTADKLGTQLDSITGSNEAESRHSNYKSNADEFNAIIGTLEKLVKPNAAKIL